VGSLVNRIQEEVERRRSQPRQPRRRGEAKVLEHPQFLTSQAHLAAVNDAINNLPAIYEERAWIQENRRRSDLEIFQTVRALSFDAYFDVADYRQAQQHLFETLGFRELFGEALNPDITFTPQYEEQP
jgi:hypothetical protein